MDFSEQKNDNVYVSVMLALTKRRPGAYKGEKRMALTKGNTMPGWLTTGKEANDTLQREQARVTNIRPTALRYWMSPGETASITFLDGSLDEDGGFDIPMYFEHNVKMVGH